MVLERWKPSALRLGRPARAVEEMERYMDEILAGWPFRTWRRLPVEDITWSAPVELYEKEDKFIVRLELPGIKTGDVNISATGDRLIVRGERKVNKEVKEEEYHRSEFAYGSFSCSIVMPAPVDEKKIEATYEDGILELTVPKAEKAKPSKIKIKTKGT